MKKKIKMIQENHLEYTKQTICEVVGELEKHQLSFVMDSNGRFSVSFEHNEIVLQSQTEVRSKIVLSHTQHGICTIDSPYGRMQFKSKLCHGIQTEDLWEVHYQLLDEDNSVVLDQTIVFELGDLQ